MIWFWSIAGILVVTAIGLAAAEVRRKHLARWLPAYWRGRRRLPEPGREIHVLLCIADHYEPKAYGADRAQADRRVATWALRYPAQFGRFRDSDGRTPRHSFFYPSEEYEPELLDALADLCRQGFGEVEIHLHHDDDTSAGVRRNLESFRDLLVERHGLLGRDSTGAIRYGFIHGNWALCNSRPDGKLCGVNDELAILRATGCYADFTFPSAPDVTQPPIINRIYYAEDRPGEPCSHETETARGLLMVQGPLVLDWTHRKFGLLPRTENACLQGTQPASMARLENWLRAGVQVPNRPDWYFVKLHAHGASEDAHEALLGESMVRFHEGLAERARREPTFHYHYVTAREMVNLARAAEAGFAGPVAEALDFEIVSNLKITEPRPLGSAT